MARTLFFRMIISKSSEITNNKPIFSQCKIFYTYEYLCFDFFSIIAKDFSQIRNNVVCVVARLVSLFCCVLTTGRCNAFRHILVN